MLNGESEKVEDASIENWLDKLPNIIKNYEPKDIFNVDECGLFYKSKPNRMLSFKVLKYFDGKKSKDRITFML